MPTPLKQEGNLNFRCADLGHANCNWQATGRSGEDIMRQVQQHGREKHNVTEWTDEMKNKVRTAIKKVAA